MNANSISLIVIPRNNEVDLDPHGYKPTLSICILFLCLFGDSSRLTFALSTVIHFSQALFYRKWFLLYTAVLAGLVEILGWSGRLWSNQNLPNSTVFTVQITCTIMGPTPLLAANFIILAGVITVEYYPGHWYSALTDPLTISNFKTQSYSSHDFIALAVQGGGGGIASAAKDTADTVNLGSHIMLSGIVFQLVVIICYVVLAIEFFWRYSRGRPVCSGSGVVSKPSTKFAVDKHDRLMIYALILYTSCLFIRAIYRTIELTDGFHGKIIETQWLFNIFDGAMIVLAMYAFNVAHPGRLLVEDKETVMYTSTGSVLGVGNGGSTGTLQQLPGEKIQDFRTV
ncbi:RTA1 like protein-domain-containing protein [Lentinula edodes]|uniref:RTA1 like protein-domain-containing protein n=1 Tax=Lentinula edodes TaxID=5353 RepID=UPI001E8CC2DD|nr:RTA1 like protein-domain-containing protein [Lentinula edodes]KAH7870545.1 RTA1 like protein-domain-containing protein [Lentinula edodes]